MKQATITTDPELLRRIQDAASREVTPEERWEQRVSFAYGQLSHRSTLTKDDVRRIMQDRGK